MHSRASAGTKTRTRQYADSCMGRLYVNVITTIKGFGNLMWTEVVAQIDAMGDQVNVFQAQSKKLPKVRRSGSFQTGHIQWDVSKWQLLTGGI